MKILCLILTSWMWHLRTGADHSQITLNGEWVELGKPVTLRCLATTFGDYEDDGELIEVEWRHKLSKNTVVTVYWWNKSETEDYFNPNYESDLDKTMIRRNHSSLLHYREAKLSHDGNYSCIMNMSKTGLIVTTTFIKVYQVREPYVFDTITLNNKQDKSIECNFTDLFPKPKRIEFFVTNEEEVFKRVKSSSETIHHKEENHGFHSLSTKIIAPISQFDTLNKTIFICDAVISESPPIRARREGALRSEARRQQPDKGCSCDSDVIIIVLLYSTIVAYSFDFDNFMFNLHVGISSRLGRRNSMKPRTYGSSI